MWKDCYWLTQAADDICGPTFPVVARVIVTTASGGRPATILRFGGFELDQRSGDLRKRGFRTPLRAQTVQVLLALVARPGQVVSREECARGCGRTGRSSTSIAPSANR